MVSVYDCLIAPVITEKAMMASKNSAYVFHINVNATKLDVRRSVETVFDVKVKKVNIVNRYGKSRIFRGKVGVRDSKKFAIVSLSSGSINFEGGI